MRVCGVICEFDPFHAGHAYLLRELRARTEAEGVVCVMSGDFTQRGEPALLEKRERAEMALRCGADLVFELPALFAVRDAQRFAAGGVALLESLGVVTHLGFGSESGDPEALRAAARMPEDPSLYRADLQGGAAPGRARSRAAGMDPCAPNDVLAVEYLRACGERLVPVAVRRQGAGHHGAGTDGWASGSALRRAIRAGEIPAEALPCAQRVEELVRAGRWTQEERFDLMLLSYLRQGPDLSRAADAAEGLENRLLKAARQAVTRAELLELARCKRYTRARLSRVALQGLLGITREAAARGPEPAYARLLGFREEARPLLRAIRAQARIPVIHRAAAMPGRGEEQFAIDERAGMLWDLLCAAREARSGSDRNAPPRRVADQSADPVSSLTFQRLVEPDRNTRSNSGSNAASSQPGSLRSQGPVTI